MRNKREAEESAEELELRSYGSRLRYQCGLARKFLDPETGKHYDERWMTCNWNSSWTLFDSLDTCEWVACLYPPDPPEEALLALQWDGQPIEFDGNVSYTCKDENLYFEADKDMPEYNVTCLEDGSWDEPAEWPVCFNCEFRIYSFGSKNNFTAVNCTHPPEKAAAGTWEWNGNLNYGTEVLYTCGPYGNFLDAEGFLYEEMISRCR